MIPNWFTWTSLLWEWMYSLVAPFGITFWHCASKARQFLITTNYLEEAQELCSRIAIIDHGRLVALDTPEELKQQFGGSVVEIETAEPFGMLAELRALPGIKDVELDGQFLKVTTQSGTNVVPQVINLAAQCCEIRDITIREPNLDEVFLHLTGTALRD